MPPASLKCDKMLSEALEGEARLVESTEERSRLRARLGLSPNENGRGASGIASVATPAGTAEPRRNQRKPGQRRPIRDAVGSQSIYANAANL